MYRAKGEESVCEWCACGLRGEAAAVFGREVRRDTRPCGGCGCGMGAGALRRSHALAAIAAAALLLLLLTRLPPAAPPAPRTPPPPAPLLPHVAAHNRSEQREPSPSAPLTNLSSSSSMSPAPPAAPLAPAAPAAAHKQQAKGEEGEKGERPVLVRDVYEAGHLVVHAELCPALGARLRLLILVSSAPAHAAARDAVRLTWGHYARRSDVALAFVLGRAPPALQPALDAEDALYNDLIVGRSLDTYSNLTLKTLSMLEWVEAYCPRAPRVLKTDDDMFINVPRLLEFAAAPARANATRTVWGKVVRKWLPKRAPSSKYYVSPLQYPGATFPEFATGPAYLLTADCVAPLLRAAPSERYVRLEDVFVTGVLAAKLRLRRVHAPEFYNRRLAPHACALRRALSIHMVRYHEQFDLWKKLLDGLAKCPS